MLHRLSASTLFRLVIGTLAAGLLLTLGLRVAEAWRTLARDAQTLAIVDVSGSAFKVLVSQRTDRSTTMRTWAADAPITPQQAQILAALRGVQMPALQATIDKLGEIAFEGRDATIADLRRSQETLLRLQAEHTQGVAGPKSARRPALGQEYQAAGLKLQATLEDVGARLLARVKSSDAVVGQLLQAKEQAWMVRNVAGEASLLISLGLNNGRPSPGMRQAYDRHVGGSESAWAAMEATLAGLPVDPALQAAVTRAKDVLFDADYMARRAKLVDAILEGTPPGMTADEWTPYTVPRLGVTQDVAEATLAAARTLAAASRAGALSSLVLQVTLMAAALVLSLLAMLAIHRRLIRPLHGLRDAMAAIAAGNLAIPVHHADRPDEIGALARALVVFQRQAKEKRDMESERARLQEEEAARQQAIGTHIRSFDGRIGETLGGFGTASDRLGHASAEMEAIALQSNEQARTAATAASETSSNVASIAAATEQLSASIAEIGQQVLRATEVTRRAVEETQATDGTVHGLSAAAERIGEVVDLIHDIAGRTNLLALNATIEAARAGEAGRGFAVVASEVKNLANQTAKATQDISAQIDEVRTVTTGAVAAIRRIGVTIGEVSDVAASIAAGIEQQGASTQEIARNAQQASHLTRQMSHTVAQVTEGADATGKTALAVKAAAEDLDTRAKALRAEVQVFLTSIQAA